MNKDDITTMTERQTIAAILELYLRENKWCKKIAAHIAAKLSDRRALLACKRGAA